MAFIILGPSVCVVEISAMQPPSIILTQQPILNKTGYDIIG